MAVEAGRQVVAVRVPETPVAGRQVAVRVPEAPVAVEAGLQAVVRVPEALEKAEVQPPRVAVQEFEALSHLLGRAVEEA